MNVKAKRGAGSPGPAPRRSMRPSPGRSARAARRGRAGGRVLVGTTKAIREAVMSTLVLGSAADRVGVERAVGPLRALGDDDRADLEVGQRAGSTADSI